MSNNTRSCSNRRRSGGGGAASSTGSYETNNKTRQPKQKKNATHTLLVSITAMAMLYFGDFIINNSGSQPPIIRMYDYDEEAFVVIEGDESLSSSNSNLFSRHLKPLRRPHNNGHPDRVLRRKKKRQAGRAAGRARERQLQKNWSMFAKVVSTELAGPARSQEQQAEVQSQLMELVNAINDVASAGIFTTQEENDGDSTTPATTFRVNPMNAADSVSPPELFVPSQVFIEVVNPKPDCRYSVTLVQMGKYTGTAMLLAPEQAGTTDSLVYSWKPNFHGRYEVLVHEIDGEYGHKTPLIDPSPFTLYINKGTKAHEGTDLALIEERIQNLPPCQTIKDVHLYSHWDGDWIGPDYHLESSLSSSIRTGWSFVPNPASSNMNCKLETFNRQEIQSIPTKKSIYILGRSVERGVFLSLVDMMLDKNEKKMLKHSVIGKCWGRASVTKGNLEVMYQDFRVNAFEDPTQPKFIECHNDKLVKQPGSSFIANATQVWDEIFKTDESNWPSVLFLVTGLGASQFKFDHHVLSFVEKLPPSWDGTLFLGDFSFSARDGGLVDSSGYHSYRAHIADLASKLNDERIRWIDGVGISKEMRMYGQKHEDNVARSQHFHHPCMRKDPDDPSEAMVVCSNVTEMIGQVLLGHALGPKEEFVKQVQESSSSMTNGPSSPRTKPSLRWCHACPKCMIPFHISPYPEMECVDGPITAKTEYDDCSALRESRPGLADKDGPAVDPLVCPQTCLESEVTSSFGSESDTVFVRQCPISE